MLTATQSRNRADTLAALPPVWPEPLLPRIQAELACHGRKVFVLDDDPTGTQTVHDVPVLTTWDVDVLVDEMTDPDLACYVLTNSRSVSLAEAQALNAAIGRNLVAAARATQRDFVVVSRSDSTLRGHFPGEVEALVSALDRPVDAWLVIPYFLEGGRLTIDDVHYVAEGERLTPAGETEFARDRVFGYCASNLREWVAEKTGGRVAASDVASISLMDLRTAGPQRVKEKLLGLTSGRMCVVNAVDMRDIEVFVAGLLDAEAAGKRFVYRTAASFVQTRIGQQAQPLLTPRTMALPNEGGALIIIGSYVPKTTSQVQALLDIPDLVHTEIDITALLGAATRAAEIERVTQVADEALTAGRDVALFTSRSLVAGDSEADSLAIGQSVSAALVIIVRGIQVRPRYVLAKGGITSSDIATRGLNVRRGIVLGQVLPGVPVWRLGDESAYPGLAYIVFPGNVGGPDALAEVVTRLRGR